MSKPRRLWSAREKVYAAALIVFLLGSLLFYAGMSYGQSIGAKNQPDAYNYGGPSGDYTYMVYTFTNDSGVFYSAKDAFGNILWSSNNASSIAASMEANAVATGTRYSVVFSVGLFNITKTLDFSHASSVSGQGQTITETGESIVDIAAKGTVITSWYAINLITINSFPVKISGANLEKLTLYGSGKTNGYSGVYSRYTNVQVARDVQSLNSSYGFYFEGCDTPTLDHCGGQADSFGVWCHASVYLKVLGGDYSDNLQNGIVYEATHNGAVSAVTTVRNVASNIELQRGSTGVTVSGCTSWGSNIGVNVNGTGNLPLSPISIVGNQIFNNVAAGIVINNSTNVMVTGNDLSDRLNLPTVSDGHNAATQLYGITEINTADSNTITGNTFAGNIIAPYSLIGLHTKATSNIGAANYDLTYRFYEDFTGVALDTVVWSVTADSGASAAIVAGTGGLCRLNSSTTNGQNVVLNCGGLRSWLTSKSVVFEVGVTLSSATSQLTYLALNTASGSGQIGFKINTATSANWTLTSYDGSTTALDTGIAVDANYHVLRFESSATVAQFFIDGVNVGNITSHIPSVILEPYFFDRTLTGAYRLMDLDFVMIEQSR